MKLNPEIPAKKRWFFLKCVAILASMAGAPVGFDNDSNPT